jgi:NADH dehydrogenase FAD-containing subunit
MAISRRDVLKTTTVLGASSVLAGCGVSTNGSIKTPKSKDTTKQDKILPKSKGNRVVIVGAGFGGLSVAKYVKIHNKDAEVVLLEKRDSFMSCPYSNLYLGDIEGVTLDKLIFDYNRPATKYGYRFIHTEVTDIDRDTQTVTTTKGIVDYDILVLAPGIEYNYEAQFKEWSKEKINDVYLSCPPALIPGSEHLALKRELDNLKGGNVVLTVPNGKYRCPPAPYERACMMAEHIKKNNIDAKVIILDTLSKPKTKAAAFNEAYTEVYGDIIEFRGNSNIKDIDTKNKKIIYQRYANEEDLDGKEESLEYSVFNFIPTNKANSIIKKSGIKTYGWGSAVLDEPSFRSVTDDKVYVVGDCVGYTYPESGQMANSMGKICAKHIADRLAGRKVDENEQMPFNICLSMVNGQPEEAIYVTHEVSFVNNKIKVKSNVPKDKESGKYRTAKNAQATHDWFVSIMNDLFN